MAKRKIQTPSPSPEAPKKKKAPKGKGKKGEKPEKGPPGRPALISIKQAVAILEQEYGAGLVLPAIQANIFVPRFPFGIFPLDFHLAGGAPHGRIVMIYGRKGSAKTSTALKLAASYQRRCADCLNLDGLCGCKGGLKKRAVVIMDLERSLEIPWAIRLGVLGMDAALPEDPRYRVLVSRPDYGEEAVDIIDLMLRAHDVGLVILDSVDALVPKAEANESANQQFRAIHARLNATLQHKVAMAMAFRDRQGTPPTLVAINQVRSKMNPQGLPIEIAPGGLAQMFYASVVIRLRPRSTKDEHQYEWASAAEATRQDATPLRAWNRYLIEYSKTSAPMVSGEFALVLRDHGGLKVGDIDDYEETMRQAVRFGIAEQHDSVRLQTAWLQDRGLYETAQIRIIAAANALATI